MKVTLISIPVRDQQKALAFYTEKLGFLVKKNEDLGNGNYWITLVAKDWQNGPELLLEPAPNHFEPSKVYQDALLEAGIPYTQFSVEDLSAEFDRLIEMGVSFTMKPSEMGNVKVAIFNDECENLIQLVEEL
ncbi:VOC family protein [Mesonia sp.]|uniref:VOC family protein n=1 Tax=Mesonia sp. TaxID=1960830 RepID=UPI001767AD28|nr:VOC family protein [Mesonia sp.]HIB36810.1 VOC family protein [Mesonia sp.]